MPSPSETITPSLLRGWPLPSPGGDKHSRGNVVVGGAVAVPEAAVVRLQQNEQGSVLGSGADRLDSALESTDVVLVGPGLDEPDETAQLVEALLARLGADIPVVLDAYGLGVLPGLPDVQSSLRGRLILTPNSSEAARLLEVDEIADFAKAVPEMAERFGAVVSCQDVIAGPAGRCWQTSTGSAGLGTSGSGDVLAGAVAGLVARGADLAQATCWGTHLHGAAGDRLAARVGPLGYLARELVEQLPLAMVELSVG